MLLHLANTKFISLSRSFHYLQRQRNMIISGFSPAINFQAIYRTRAIISRGLYIFYPIFKDHFFVFKKVFSENSVLMYGLYSRAASNQERLMMARIRCIVYTVKLGDRERFDKEQIGVKELFTDYHPFYVYHKSTVR